MSNPDIPTERMAEALALRDSGLSITEVAVRMGISRSFASVLIHQARVRTGQPVEVRKFAGASEFRELLERVRRLESQNQSLRARTTNLEREVKALRRAVVLPPTHRRIVDGGIGGRRERRAAA